LTELFIQQIQRAVTRYGGVRIDTTSLAPPHIFYCPVR
jgi:hypothetical protein